MSDRRVILKMVVSLDGFATSPDGTHEWMFEWFGEESSERNLRALEEAGVHGMGRRSYEIMGPHWAASEGPSGAPAGRLVQLAGGEDQRELARVRAELLSEPGQRHAPDRQQGQCSHEILLLFVGTRTGPSALPTPRSVHASRDEL